MLQGTKPQVNADGLQGVKIDMIQLQGTKTDLHEDGLLGITTEANASEVQDLLAKVVSRRKHKSKKNLGEGGHALQKLDDLLKGFEKN